MRNTIRKIFFPFFASLTMLTKFNLPALKKINYSDNDITNSVVFFPVIGLIYGLIIFYINQLMIFFNISLMFKAAVILILPFLMNNFFHFDGLCDMLDGFLANKDKQTRLKILKDTNIGSFALGGAVLFMLLKYLGLLSLLSKNHLIIFLILMPVFSRMIMVILSYKSIYPRTSGTASLIVGKISSVVFLLSILIFLIVVTGFLFFTKNYNALIFNLEYILITTLSVVFFFILFKIYSYKKIGGITGDVLGASCELFELAVIFVLLFSNKWIIK